MYVGIVKTGIVTAFRLFFKALGAASCLYYLSLSTPLVDILSTLRRLRCPKLLLELMGLMYRSIFVLLETAETMIIAQNSRLGYSDVRTGFRSMSALASTLFIRAYKRSEDLYIALEARGYDGELNVLEEPFKRSLKGYMTLLILNLMLIAAALYLKTYTGGIL
jgi:cobalt/nickel transport system permease protein